MAPSKLNPVFMRKDTPDRFEWRIRNLPYPKEVYTILIDHAKQEIVLKTSNKKYYKRFDIPDMKRCGLQLEDSEVVWKYQNNTVIIGYDKPDKVKEMDEKKKKDIQTLGSTGGGGNPAPRGSAAQSLLGGPGGQQQQPECN